VRDDGGVRYAALVFDFYGTLAETPDWGPSWEDLVAELGYTLPADVRDRWWNEAFDGTEHDEHSRSRDHYVAWQQSRLRAMLAECGLTDDDATIVIERVREISGHRRIQPYDDALHVLAALRDRGHAIAICSNWDWDLLEAIASAGLTGSADVVVSSAWVGARKPHPRIYAHTLAQLEVEPCEALFVGDTWGPDVAGPLAAGMQPVYVRRGHREPDTTAPDGAADPEVPRLEDLCGLLDLA
jgi:putative hydrolase of the HAD superfamily